MRPLSRLLTAPTDQQARFFEDTRGELQHAVRAFAIFVGGLLLLFMLEDWLSTPDQFLELFRLKLVALLVLVAMLHVSRRKAFRSGAEWLHLIAAVLIYATAVGMAHLTGDLFMVPVAVIVGSVGTAVLLPWRLRYQLTFYLVSLGVLGVHVAMNHAWPPPLPLSRDTVAGIALGGAAVLLHLYANDRRFLLWQTQIRLRESDEQFHQLAQHSNDIIWIWRPDQSVEYLSDAYELYTGRPASEVLHSPRRALHMVVPEDRADFADAIREIAAGGARKMDLRVRHENGDLFHLEGWGTAIKDGSGTVLRCIGIWRDVTERVHLIEDLDRAAITDPLTGAFNRRHFQARYLGELARANQDGRPLALVLLDIDHFKQINDTHGHPVGDEVLIELVRRCTGELRPEALFARFGGEEFVVLLPETDGDEARAVAERLHAAVSAKRFVVDGTPLSVTASLGVVAKSGEDSADAGWLIQQADQALYSAKEAGRNRVLVA